MPVWVGLLLLLGKVLAVKPQSELTGEFTTIARMLGHLANTHEKTTPKNYMCVRAHCDSDNSLQLR